MKREITDIFSYSTPQLKKPKREKHSHDDDKIEMRGLQRRVLEKQERLIDIQMEFYSLAKIFIEKQISKEE